MSSVFDNSSFISVCTHIYMILYYNMYVYTYVCLYVRADCEAIYNNIDRCTHIQSFISIQCQSNLPFSDRYQDCITIFYGLKYF